jgi:cyclase
MLAGFDAIITLGRPDTKIVPGHGAIADRAAVAAHKAMMEAVRDKVAELVRQNKSQEKSHRREDHGGVRREKVTGVTPQTADRFVSQLYRELKPRANEPTLSG